MSDTETMTPHRLIEQARESLRVIDDQIDEMRERRERLRVDIAQALEDRKPLARIVAASEPRKARRPKSADNGDQ